MRRGAAEQHGKLFHYGLAHPLDDQSSPSSLRRERYNGIFAAGNSGADGSAGDATAPEGAECHPRPFRISTDGARRRPNSGQVGRIYWTQERG